MPKMHWVLVIPVAIFCVALFLRLIGISWGLKNDLHNQTYHPDEGLIFSYSRTIEPTQGKFTPGFYNYGTLYLTVLRVASDVVSAYTGGPDDKNEEATWAWVSRCHLAGRVLSALAGAGMALFVCLIVMRFTGPLGAAAAGLCIAFAPGHVVHSRFQTVDILAAFFLTVSAWYALRLIPQEGHKPFNAIKISAWCGVFAGLSAGTKYTGILALLSLVAVVVMAKPAKPGLVILTAIGSALGVFFLTTPGAILDFPKFLNDFKFEMTHTSTGHGLVFAGTPSGFIYHLMNLGTGIGPILTILGLAGLGIGVYKRQAWLVVLFAFALPYYLLIGRAEVKFLRYTFPLYVSVAAGFGFLIDRAHRRGGASHALVGLGILGLGGVDPGGLRMAATMTAWMAGEDPRDSAARALKEKATKDPSITVGLASDPWFYTPPFYPNTGLGPRAPWFQRTQLLRSATLPKLAYHIATDAEGVRPNEAGGPFSFDVRLLTEDRPTYVVLCSFEFEDLERIKNLPGLEGVDKLLVTRYQQFRTRLEADYGLDSAYGIDGPTIHDLEYIQPSVLVWKRKITP